MNLDEMWAKYQSMSPSEQAQARRQVQSRWSSLSPSEKQQVMNEARRRYNELSPEDKSWVMGQVRDNWDHLTPSQQAQFSRHLPRAGSATQSRFLSALMGSGISSGDLLGGFGHGMPNINNILRMLSRFR